MEHTRRDFLKAAAMLSGATGVAGFVPDSIQRAFAIEPEPGSTYLDAEHIVILMQENRSFDHALGTLQGVRGFNDPRALRLANGNSVFVQTNAEGDSYAPWRLDIKDTRITWMGSVPHSRDSQIDAWNGGQHNNWLDAKRVRDYAHLPLTMGHYTREDIPFYYALADAFTICDQSYCAVMSSTTPNRSVFWTGTIRDEQNVNSRVFVRNDEILIGDMTWKTYPERLHEAGIDWKFYQNELTNQGGLSKEEEAWLSNYGCNLLEFFAAYNVEAYEGSVAGMKEQIASLMQQIDRAGQQLQNAKDPETVTRLHGRISSNRDHVAKLKAQLADSGEARYKQLTEQQRTLHDAAFVTNVKDPHYRSLEAITFEDGGKHQKMNVPKGDILHQFRKDVNEGKLAAVSWLAGPEKFSDHPSNPWYGAWYVSEVMNILTKNPEVWKKTIFILTYDENDGYFDHAPSFVAADPKKPSTGRASAGIDTGIEYTSAQDELRQGISARDARSGPIGLGYRVPTIVASPWSRGGWVNSQVFDHTSTLQFLEEFMRKKYGKTVREDNISAWRRTVCGDLTSCFRPYDPKEPTLAFLDRDQFVASIERARYKEIPSNFKKLTPAQVAEINSNPRFSQLAPHQEQGIRPSCALPYELYADGALSDDRTKFELHLKAGRDVHGIRSAGAPFNVYLRNTIPTATAGGPGMGVATYVVKPGDVLSEAFPLSLFTDGQYSVDVHGPNGFYRSFTGNASMPALQVHASYERRGSELTGNIQVLLRNSADPSLTVAVRDNSYGTGTISKPVPPGHEASIVLNLERNHGWYDFTVQTGASKAEARFAGRVETGHSSFSDPLMGGTL
jgi:phospholipase C